MNKLSRIHLFVCTDTHARRSNGNMDSILTLPYRCVPPQLSRDLDYSNSFEIENTFTAHNFRIDCYWIIQKRVGCLTPFHLSLHRPYPRPIYLPLHNPNVSYPRSSIVVYRFLLIHSVIRPHTTHMHTQTRAQTLQTHILSYDPNLSPLTK